MRSRRLVGTANSRLPLPLAGRGQGWACAAKGGDGRRRVGASTKASALAPPSPTPSPRGGRGFERTSQILLVAIGIAALATGGQAAETPRYGIGRTPTPAEIAGWDIDVRADGAGLPPGHGTVSDGQAVYEHKCAACHGDQGQGDPMDALVGGKGTLATAKPVRTVGSYWPYATTLYDYVHRAMPFNAPQSLTPDQVYAVTAYVLFLNGIVPRDAVMDARSLPRVRMPNRNGFTSPDPRPDVPRR